MRYGYREVGVLLLVVSFIFFIPIAFSAEEKPKTPELTNEDCIKCHPKIVMQVEEKGGKHKTEVGCLDCHEGHPPMVAKEEIIPSCDMCHSGEPHFQLKNCMGCHTNPHTPLAIKFKGKIVSACLTCHSKEGKELKEHPSAHTKLACNQCHTHHREIPPCFRCHSAHTAEMKNQDCLACHPPHKPLVITYGTNIPNSYCAACHDDIADILNKNHTKHHELACVYCHRGKHAVVPACETCHGAPHPQTMLAKFPQCVDCHKDAHNLVK